MGIVFYCQSCAARFEVAPRMAGKRGHCKKCGQFMTIPKADEVVAMAAPPAMAGAGAGGPSIGAWLRSGASQAALAPITVDRMPVGWRPKPKGPPSALDDAEDSKPYVLAQPVREGRGAVRAQDNMVLRVWRQQVGGVQRIFRWINETAYLVSVPFIMMLLLGTALRSRPMALTGAGVVVLLNIGRLIAGGAGLALVPFRDGLDWKKLKKPLRRVAEPALTIGLVILAFFFFPWLSTGKTSTRGIAGRINSGLEAMEKRTRSELDKAGAIEQAQKRP